MTETSEKLELLGKYLEEAGYKIFVDRVMRVRDNFGDFVISDADLHGSKLSVCGDVSVDLANPASFPVILAAIRYCKDRSGVNERFANASRLTDDKAPVENGDYCDGCPLNAKS